MTRQSEIKEQKALANAKGHKMGNVTNVSPFGSFVWQDLPVYTVHSACRRCRRGMYIEKRGKKVKAWGDALQTEC